MQMKSNSRTRTCIPVHKMDNDDGSLVRRDTSITSDNTTRRVLGNVSPNIRNPAAAKLLLANKPMAGSPLKRSWDTMDGTGFTYFKKRKLSMDTPLSSQIFNVPRNTDSAAAYVNEHVMQESPQDSDSVRIRVQRLRCAELTYSVERDIYPTCFIHKAEHAHRSRGERC